MVLLTSFHEHPEAERELSEEGVAGPAEEQSQVAPYIPQQVLSMEILHALCSTPAPGSRRRGTPPQ